MNILMVCPQWFPVSAGLAQSCYELCKQLEHHGHKVRVIVTEEPNTDMKDLDVIPLPYTFNLLGRNPVVFGLRKKIQDYLHWADVVGVFSYMYLLNSSVVKLCNTMDKPVVHFYRGSLESDSLHHLSFTTRLAKKLYDATFAKPLFQNVDAVISNSEPTLTLMHKRYGTPQKKLHYVHNALTLKEYKTSTKKEKRILFVGRLVDNKGIRLFPEIIKHIPDDWTFTIVDDGPLRGFVEDLQKKHSNIELLGKIPHQELLTLMSHSALLILPTYAEGSPRAVMEAAASGIPSIAFAVGDVSNMIPAGTGYAVPPFNLEQFCKNMRYLIDHPKEREAMGKKARTFAEQHLDWKIVYPKIEKILQTVKP